MSGSFAKLIKMLKRETLEIKNTHRRSTLTVETVTRKITVPITATANASGIAIPTSPVIKITFNSDEPQLYMVTFDSTDPLDPFVLNNPTKMVTASDENVLLLDIGEAGGQTPGATVTANPDIYITSTGDFTLTLI